jgi:hypothetical protein
MPIATPVACDPELLRARAAARAKAGDHCSTKAKKKCGSPSTTQHADEVHYNEAVARALEAAQEALSSEQIRALTQGAHEAQEATAKALRELGVQGHCQQKALREMAVQGQCSQEALRALTEKDRHLAVKHELLEKHAHELAQAGEHMRALQTHDLLAAQGDAESALAALEGVNGESIREKIRSTLGKLGRVHEDGDDESGDDMAEEEDSDDESHASYYDSGDDEDDDGDRSSLESRIRALEELARERGHDVDDDDSKSLEDRVESLERLMRRTPGAYSLRTLPRINAEDWKKQFGEFKDWKRYKVGDSEVLVMPEGGDWSMFKMPEGQWTLPRAAKPGKAPKARAFTWKKSTEDGDDEDDSDDDDSDDEEESPEPPEAPAPGQAFAPSWPFRMAPKVNAETRREIESLMKDMRAQIDSMRGEMERLREELVRASRRGAR